MSDATNERPGEVGLAFPDSWGHWIDRNGNHWWIFGKPGEFMAQCLNPETGIPEHETPNFQLQELKDFPRGGWSKAVLDSTLQADCERWSAQYARQSDELVIETARADQWNRDFNRVCDDLDKLKARLAEVEQGKTCPRCDVDGYWFKATKIAEQRLAEVEEQLQVALVSMTETALELASVRPAKEAAEKRVKVLTERLELEGISLDS